MVQVPNAQRHHELERGHDQIHLQRGGVQLRRGIMTERVFTVPEVRGKETARVLLAVVRWGCAEAGFEKVVKGKI